MSADYSIFDMYLSYPASTTEQVPFSANGPFTMPQFTNQTSFYPGSNININNNINTPSNAGPFTYADSPTSSHGSTSNGIGPSSSSVPIPGQHGPSVQRPLQFQIPQFVMPGSQLVAGGGAEVVSPMTFSAMQQQASPYATWVNTGGWSGVEKKIVQDDGFNASVAMDPWSMPTPISTRAPRPRRTLMSTDMQQLDTAVAVLPLPPTPAPLPLPQSIQPPTPVISTPIPSIIDPPTVQGVPVYSSTGFDLLPLLSRVFTRPNPQVSLGPVDCTCSFVVVDTHHYDAPIVYASPNFCALTGYDEHEILGRNCRFLQDRGGLKRRDNPAYPSVDAVYLLKKSIGEWKECQFTLENYRKDGTPFQNFLTVIPISGENEESGAGEARYLFGFQVDLKRQPGVIAGRLRDGLCNTTRGVRTPVSRVWDERGPVQGSSSSSSSKMPRKTSKISKELADFMVVYAARNILPETTERHPSTDEHADSLAMLNPFILRHSPDFIHVLSLKGTFLYVSASVRDVLGYDAEELVNASITDFCHEQDVVPIMRELKESSILVPVGPNLNTLEGTGVGAASILTGAGEQSALSGNGHVVRTLRPVNLLFRMRDKAGKFVWLDCVGQLHLEPTKSRKAIVLSGRVRTMPALGWGAVAQGGGVALPSLIPSSPTSSISMDVDMEVSMGRQRREDADSLYAAARSRNKEREFWGMLSSEGVFLCASDGVRDVLGWGSAEIIGRTIRDLTVEGLPVALGGTGASASGDWSAVEFAGPALFPCKMTRKDGHLVDIAIVIHRAPRSQDVQASSSNAPNYYPPIPIHQAQAQAPHDTSASPHPLICQFRPFQNPSPSPSSSSSNSNSIGHIEHPLDDNVLEELDVRHHTSWQYELQQLKLDNRRLMEEVKDLEMQVGERKDLMHDSGSNMTVTAAAGSSYMEFSALPGAPYSRDEISMQVPDGRSTILGKRNYEER